MSDKHDKEPNPYALVALFSGGASVLIAMIALMALHTISDGGMWAIAAMVAAPALMGIGIAYFISRHPPH